MKACEDSGVMCVDNIPLSLIFDVLRVIAAGDVPKVALCSDVRSQPFESHKLLEQIAQLRREYVCKVIFLQSRTDVLLARFNATKHRHPLYGQGHDAIEDNILAEQQMLADVLLASDVVIDSSDYTPHQLKQQLQRIVSSAPDEMAVNLMSFSYVKGVPANADMVLDVRFLRNPHYDAGLQPLTGRDAAVGAFIMQDAQAEWFLAQTKEMIARLLPLYQAEGKSYFTLAFGCTGGKHRSVFFVETFYHYLQEKGYNPTVHHRELGLDA